MGFFDKRASRSRMSPDQGPFAAATLFGPEDAWHTHEMVAGAASVRQVVLDLGSGGSRSNTGMYSNWLLKTDARVWYEASSDFTTFTVILGLTDQKFDFVPDWAQVVHLGERATVSTSVAKTVDGKLSHGDLHDQMRSHLLDALAGIGADHSQAEGAASAAALAVSPVPHPQQLSLAAVEGTMEMATSLTTDEVVALTKSWGRRCGPLDWTLDVPGGSEGGNSITLVPRPPTGHMVIVRLADAEHPLTRRYALAALADWTASLSRSLKRDDPAAHLDTTWLDTLEGDTP